MQKSHSRHEAAKHPTPTLSPNLNLLTLLPTFVIIPVISCLSYSENIKTFKKNTSTYIGLDISFALDFEDLLPGDNWVHGNAPIVLCKMEISMTYAAIHNLYGHIVDTILPVHCTNQVHCLLLIVRGASIL